MNAELSIADVLRVAKHVLIERGWTQKAYENADYNVCAVGAVNVATFGYADKDPHFDTLVPLAQAMNLAVDVDLDDLGELIGIWNDVQGRTQSEVLAAFDRAIALADEATP